MTQDEFGFVAALFAAGGFLIGFLVTPRQKKKPAGQSPTQQKIAALERSLESDRVRMNLLAQEIRTVRNAVIKPTRRKKS